MKTLSILTLIACLLVACESKKYEKPFVIIDKCTFNCWYIYKFQDKNGNTNVFDDNLLKYNIGDTIK